MKIVASAILISLSLANIAAHAAIVYDQPSVWQTNGGSAGNAWLSSSTPTLGYRSFDNFSVGGNQIINQATWRGAYLNGDFTDAAPNTASWNIGIFADNAGAPVALLSNTSLTAAQVAVQNVGTGQFEGNVITIYEFTATLNSFSAVNGTTYWFSPFSPGPASSPLKFHWLQGSGGDNLTFQQLLVSAAVQSTFNRSGDRAFSLSNNVPDSGGTVLMLALALAGVIALRRWFA